MRANRDGIGDHARCGAVRGGRRADRRPGDRAGPRGSAPYDDPAGTSGQPRPRPHPIRAPRGSRPSPRYTSSQRRAASSPRRRPAYIAVAHTAGSFALSSFASIASIVVGHGPGRSNVAGPPSFRVSAEQAAHRSVRSAALSWGRRPIRRTSRTPAASTSSRSSAALASMCQRGVVLAASSREMKRGKHGRRRCPRARSARARAARPSSRSSTSRSREPPGRPS